eukprot:SAG31_NODE_3333_length_4395_cov_2.924814_2_plen_688_part_00
MNASAPAFVPTFTTPPVARAKSNRPLGTDAGAAEPAAVAHRNGNGPAGKGGRTQGKRGGAGGSKAGGQQKQGGRNGKGKAAGSRSRGGDGGGGGGTKQQDGSQFNWDAVQHKVAHQTRTKKKSPKTSPEVGPGPPNRADSANSPSVRTGSVGRSPGGGQSSRRQTANHLLNFRLEPRDTLEDANSSRHPPARSSNSRGSSSRGLKQKSQRKLGFLHANADIRFAVQPDGCTAQEKNADLPLDWDIVQVVLFRTSSSYTCPICFESPTCPKITKCGHIFCFTCALHYLSYAADDSRKCPMCFELISAPELKSVVVETAEPVTKGCVLDMKLMQRDKSVIFSRPYDRQSATGTSKTNQIPAFGHTDAVFSKICVIDDFSPVYCRERTELEDGMKLAISAQEYSIPFFEQALIMQHEIEQAIGLQHRKKILPKPTPYVPGQGNGETAGQGDFPTLCGTREQVDPHFGAEPKQVADGGDMMAGTVVSMWSDEEGADTNVTICKSSDINRVGQDPMDSERHSGAAAANKSTRLPTDDNSVNVYHFYQATDGQLVFLSPLDYRCLLTDADDLVVRLPATLANVKAMQVERHIQDTETRKRFKFAAHIPLGATFTIVELDLQPPQVSPATWTEFGPLFAARQTKRAKQQAADRKREAAYAAQVARQQAIREARERYVERQPKHVPFVVFNFLLL